MNCREGILFDGATLSFFQKLSQKLLISEVHKNFNHWNKTSDQVGRNKWHLQVSLLLKGLHFGYSKTWSALSAFLCLDVISVFASKPETASSLQCVHVFVGVEREKEKKWKANGGRGREIALTMSQAWKGPQGPFKPEMPMLVSPILLVTPLVSQDQNIYCSLQASRILFGLASIGSHGYSEQHLL